jgi:hypothetical protein
MDSCHAPAFPCQSWPREDQALREIILDGLEPAGLFSGAASEIQSAPYIRMAADWPKLHFRDIRRG